MTFSRSNIGIVINIFLLNWFVVAFIEAKPFTLYWNIISNECQSFDIPPVDVTQKYGILQNKDDAFRGLVISILYDPGDYPEINTTLINGGVPQQGNLNKQLEAFEKEVNKLIPDPKNAGLAIIDYGSLWRPVYRQNFGKLQPYRDLSEKIVRERNPSLSGECIAAEAKQEFEKAARKFMECTIDLARQLRPKATWGFFELPYCYNGVPGIIEDCPLEVQEEDDRTQWIYDASDALYPKIYLDEEIPPNDRVPFVRGRVREALRLSKRSRKAKKPKVFPYLRNVYSDSLKFLSKKDLYEAIKTVKSIGGDGVVLWGSTFDLNTKSKCIDFYNYLENVLGPVAKSFQP